MNKKGIERNIVVVLFVLVLVAFSFAERDSKKLERFYTTAEILKKSAVFLSEVATQLPPVEAANN
ncbi:MAG: hypothetical protein M3Y85_01820 [Bacteroidota bacterium]|nr:hypothetical protein [Bacteroidota bacterium]